MLVVALIAWLWPVGFGGRMLVGGDVTRFFMGLMTVLGDSFRQGRLPVWNELWGYGFPGLAESQMGVYYPPHWLLYGLFGVETAYVTSLVVHTIWGGLGAYWAARKFGTSSQGAALTALAWSAGGFFVIHMSHPWGYTAGSWMPWVWGLVWSMLGFGPRSLSPRRAFLGLSAIFCIQLLPGHFQIAFMTQVAIALLVVWRLWNHLVGRIGTKGEARVEDGSPVSVPWRAMLVMLAIVVAFLLAAMQIWPTARLARLANQQRDLAYLAGFAATPFHLVNYVAPGLFHYDPTWRPLVWDPFITSPEEHLTYVGLAPFMLAVIAMLGLRKRDPAVRALTFVTVVALVLSLGPNVPGFRWLIMLPGFSFFRAPARWGLVVSLALALLAGKGVDAWPTLRRPGRAIVLFAVLATMWIGAIIGSIELSLATPARSDAADILRRCFGMVSLAGPRAWDSVVTAARQPLIDSQIPDVLARLKLPDVSFSTPSFVDKRFSIYFEELGQTGLALALLVGLGVLQSTRRVRGVTPVLLFILTFMDLFILGRHRMSDLETAPWKPLSEQSPVLARLASLPKGTRSVDALRNFPMIAGLAPISAYRTMDLPVAVELTQFAHSPLGFERSDASTYEAMRATGTASRTFDPVENLLMTNASKLQGQSQGDSTTKSDATKAAGWSISDPLSDPALAAWQYGSAWVNRQGSWGTTYRLGSSLEPAPRAWLVDLGGSPGVLPSDLGATDYAMMLSVFEKARPLASESSRPGVRTVEVENPTASGWIVVTDLSDPLWTARWIGRDGQADKPAEVVPVFHGSRAWGWQGVASPGPGRWTLSLDYDARDVRQGQLASAIAWIWWLVVAVFPVRRTQG